jgi:hypothetical protein
MLEVMEGLRMCFSDTVAAAVSFGRLQGATCKDDNGGTTGGNEVSCSGYGVKKTNFDNIPLTATTTFGQQEECCDQVSGCPTPYGTG